MKAFLILLLLPIGGLAQKVNMVQELDAVFAEYFKPGEPGGAILIVKDGNIIYKNAAGLADINTKELITTKTVFNVGSITKPIVSFGILQLAKEGKLSLDDPLIKYFPAFKNKAIGEKVRIIHLLTHTSGLPDLRKVNEEQAFYLVAKDKENWEPILQADSLLFEPGTRYQYSNPAFNALALIIEQLSGIKWQDYISSLVFKPASMNLSTITDGPHPESGVAHAYVRDSMGKWQEMDYGEEPTFAAAGNGGVWSNVEELWKMEQAIQQAKFLDQEWINKSRTVYPFAQWQEKSPSRLGLSWFMINDGGFPMTGHTGSQGGFRGDYCWWPEKKVFYVLLTNSPRSHADIRAKVRGIVFR